jgi:hypothetical protein
MRIELNPASARPPAGSQWRRLSASVVDLELIGAEG